MEQGDAGRLGPAEGQELEHGRAAMDSLTPCIKGASCEPMNIHWPILRGSLSMRVRT